MSDLLSQASLVLIPSGYKEDIVYSEIPTDGSGDMVFTRASDGTRINSAGLVEVVPWNLLQYSEDFSNGYWNKGAAVITTNQITAPNGTTTADKFDETATTDTHQVYTTFAGNLGVSTFSVYAKKAERSGLQITSDQATDPSAIFNLDTGVVYSSSNCTAFIESVGNGWYKCGITYTIDQTTSYPVFRTTNASFATVYAGTAGYGIYIWGAQLNIGSTAKTYFPTTNRQDVPRLTYQNGGGGCPSLLLEPQRTNLLTYSEQFDQWTLNGGTITTNSIASPDGTTTADTLTGASGNLRVYKLASGLSSIDYTFSVFAKKGTASKIWFDFVNVADGPSFDFNTKIWSTSSGWTTSYEEFQNGWFRLIATKASNTTSAGLGIKVGAVGETVYLWGAQMEAGSHKTTYTPTTSATVTRLADSAYKTGISSLIGQSEGVLFVDMVKSQNGYNYYNLSDGTNNNRIFIGQDADNPDRLRAYVRVSGATASVDINVGPVANGRYKMAIGYKLNDVVFYINGTLSGTDTNTAMPTGLSDLSLTNGTGSVCTLTNNVNQVALFKTRLSNTDLASLTTL